MVELQRPGPAPWQLTAASFLVFAEACFLAFVLFIAVLEAGIFFGVLEFLGKSSHTLEGLGLALLLLGPPATLAVVGVQLSRQREWAWWCIIGAQSLILAGVVWGRRTAKLVGATGVRLV